MLDKNFTAKKSEIKGNYWYSVKSGYSDGDDE